MSIKKENPKNYIGRTEEGIKKLLEREKEKVGNPTHLKQRRKRHIKDPRIRLREGARVRALNKGIEFAIDTYKDVPEVPGFCPIYKVPLFVGKGVSTDNSPTLDRIDNNKGYIKGNIHIISRKANQMKSNGSFKDIEMLYNYMKKQYLERRRCDI